MCWVNVFERRKDDRLFIYVNALYSRLVITIQSLICKGLLWTGMQHICLNDQIKHIMTWSVATAIKIELIPTFMCCKQMVDCFSVLLHCSPAPLDPLCAEGDMLWGQFSDKVICLQSMKRTTRKVGWAIFRVWSNSVPRSPHCLSHAAPSQVYSCRVSAHRIGEERKAALSYYWSWVFAIRYNKWIRSSAEDSLNPSLFGYLKTFSFIIQVDFPFSSE